MRIVDSATWTNAPVQLTVTDDLQRSPADRVLPPAPGDPTLRLADPLVGRGLLRSDRSVVRGASRPGCRRAYHFLAAYVRYTTHLGAYLTLVANPYLGFTGEPGYRSASKCPSRSRSGAGRSRCGCFSRSRRCSLRACSAGTRARWKRRASKPGLRRPVQRPEVDRHTRRRCSDVRVPRLVRVARARPDAERAAGPRRLRHRLRRAGVRLRPAPDRPIRIPTPARPASLGSLGPHPVRLVLEDDGRRSRLTVLFQPLLALPHLVWLALWTLAAFPRRDRERPGRPRARPLGRSAAPLPLRVRSLRGARERLHHARRESVPGLHGHARVPRRHRGGRSRAAEPLDHALPHVSRHPGASWSPALSGALAVVAFLAWFADVARDRRMRPAYGTSARSRSAIRRRRTPIGSSSRTTTRTRAPHSARHPR